jgi:hypothetical protein
VPAWDVECDAPFGCQNATEFTPPSCMKDDRTWPSPSRPARREDERLGLNVRFNQVPHTLANDVTDVILGDDAAYGLLQVGAQVVSQGRFSQSCHFTLGA